jgi:hypothetical protein
MTKDMNPQEIAEVLAKPIAQELLFGAEPARLAYTGVDGFPRAIPIGFWYQDGKLGIATVPKSAKVKALQQNPRVALTIDRQHPWPRRVLLLRGIAEVTFVEGVPQEYVDASRKVTPAELFPEWEAGVRGLYKSMAVITVDLTWAKLLDFETTIPKAVEDLIVAAQAGEGR